MEAGAKARAGPQRSVEAGAAARAGSDRWVVPAFAALVVVAGVLFYWEGRGTTYFNYDDISQFYALSWSPSSLLHPFNGNLILVSRVLFHLVSSTVGADYAVLRLLAILAVLAVDVVFFALARRLVAPLIALAASVPVLFLGTAWEAILWPSGALTWAPAVAAGLGAFLALQSSARHRDLVACGLLVLSAASVSGGLCFAAGAAVWILIDEDRWRRAWVFVIPVALWFVWWLWARKFGESELVASNWVNLPDSYANSLSWVVGAATGVTALGARGVSFDVAPAPVHSIDPVLAAIVVLGAGALLWRRRAIPREIWPPLVTLAVLWTLIGFEAPTGRGPAASRYMLAGVVLLLLVVLAAARGASLGRRSAAALCVAVVVMAAFNIVALQRAHQFFSDYSANARAQFAMLELAGAQARPGFNPASATPSASSTFVALRTADYLAGVAHYGSPADTLAEVRRSPEAIRVRADEELAAAVGLTLHPTKPPGGVRRCSGGRGDRVQRRLPAGGALIRTASGSGVLVGRFGSTPSAGIGLAAPGRWYEVELPGARLRRGWTLAAPTARRLTLCGRS